MHFLWSEDLFVVYARLNKCCSLDIFLQKDVLFLCKRGFEDIEIDQKVSFPSAGRLIEAIKFDFVYPLNHLEIDGQGGAV